MEGHTPWNKGVKYSPELKAKLKLNGLHLGHLKGPLNYRYNPKIHKSCVDCGDKVGRWDNPTRCRACNTKWLIQTKENHPRWQGGITSENKRIRSKIEWKKWREAVFARDKFVCRDCGATGYLEPHHIVPIRSDRDKAYQINNGITLCRPCHQKTIWRESNFAEKYSRLVAAQAN